MLNVSILDVAPELENIKFVEGIDAPFLPTPKNIHKLVVFCANEGCDRAGCAKNFWIDTQKLKGSTDFLVCSNCVEKNRKGFTCDICCLTMPVAMLAVIEASKFGKSRWRYSHFENQVCVHCSENNKLGADHILCNGCYNYHDKKEMFDKDICKVCSENLIECDKCSKLHYAKTKDKNKALCGNRLISPKVALICVVKLNLKKENLADLISRQHHNAVYGKNKVINMKAPAC